VLVLCALRWICYVYFSHLGSNRLLVGAAGLDLVADLERGNGHVLVSLAVGLERRDRGNPRVAPAGAEVGHDSLAEGLAAVTRKVGVQPLAVFNPAVCVGHAADLGLGHHVIIRVRASFFDDKVVGDGGADEEREGEDGDAEHDDVCWWGLQKVRAVSNV